MSPEPRGRKELVELDKTLSAVSDIVPKVRADLIDLQESAFSQAVGERPERSSKKLGWAHVDTGDPRAKQALRELDHAAAEMLRVCRAARNLFVGGSGANTALRGTLLGSEDGSGAEAELQASLAAQRRRNGRGEYVPNRSEPQPNVPGARRR